MKELTQQEFAMVSGAGIIQDTLSSWGASAGNSLYGLVSGFGFEVPVLGKVSLGSLFPDLGKTVGSVAGSTAGGVIEGVIAHIPVVGGWLNKLLGN